VILLVVCIGGFTGSAVFMAMSSGASRGIFSNEAVRQLPKNVLVETEAVAELDS
jgi:Na+/alanine symporter